MQYISTRGQGEPACFLEVLLEGLAPDGGLYVPDRGPIVSLDVIESWRALPYSELACEILSLFAPEIPKDELLAMTRRVYTQGVFGHGRPDSDTQKIFPVRKVEDGLFLLELSNGPTLAFKDAAMQLLGELLVWALEKKDATLTVLGATSGDTGSAAIEALRGRPRVRVVMLSPSDRMSDFQRAQMYSVQDKNVLNIAIKGTFDDCQDLVKKVNHDLVFKEKYHIGAVNSINWVRVVAQCVYYFAAYFQITERTGDLVSFAVPSGNFGNAYAGSVAKGMGLPIKKIIVATNENDILFRLFETGQYVPEAVAKETSSPSMDITRASNFERAAYDAALHDGIIINALWQQLREEGRIDFPNEAPMVWAEMQRLGYVPSSNDHTGRIGLMRYAKESWGLFIDPHTADGLKGALAYKEKGVPMVVLETAQAAKFAQVVQEALDCEPPMPEGFGDLPTRARRVEVLPVDVEELKRRIESF